MSNYFLISPDYDRVFDDLDTYGFHCIHDALQPDLVDQLSAVVDNESFWHKSYDPFHKTNAFLVPNLVNKSTCCLDIVTETNINYITSRFFEQGAHSSEKNIYQLHLMHGRVLVDKTPSQQLHIDSRCCGINP